MTLSTLNNVDPRTYPADKHEIDYTLIDPDALWVLRRLNEAGHTAYLVGGSVRDLLAKTQPKDFDISTSARPEEVKKVFGRRCLLIGRRFRLAHIRFGHKVIEVATFRTGENADELIVRDNEWGTPQEDVLRRDFTMNGLFYDPEKHTVIDYVGGWDDIHNKIIRSIGDPIVRFKQDPVRMIRLLKFRARFGFEIDSDSADALERCGSEILKSAPARILEELLRMLESGYATSFIHLMGESGLLDRLFPRLTDYLEGPQGDDIYDLLDAADEMNTDSNSRPLDRSVLASCLIYPILESEIDHFFVEQNETPKMGDVILFTNEIMNDFITASFSQFPKRLSATMGYILTTQYRLTPPGNRRINKKKLFENHDFPHALSFLKLRSLVDEKHTAAYSSWKNNFKEQQHLHQPRKKRPPRRRPHARPR